MYKSSTKKKFYREFMVPDFRQTFHSMW